MQFTLTHRGSIPGSSSLLFSIALDFIFTTRHVHNRKSFLFWASHFILSKAISYSPPSSPVAYCTPSDLGGSSSSVILFYLFTLFMGFSKQEYWNGLLFPLSVNHIFSDLFPVTCPSWVVLQGMAHSFIELCKPHCHEKAVIHERNPIITLYQA